MVDVFSEEKRREIMSHIKGKNTSIELIVRSYLHALGYRFRVNDKRYPGKPDIVLPKYKTMIFVNGCFWHGHGCKYSTIPKTNTEYWKTKIENNKKRDKQIIDELKENGWNVVVIWECDIKHNFEETMQKSLKNLNSIN